VSSQRAGRSRTGSRRTVALLICKGAKEALPGYALVHQRRLAHAADRERKREAVSNVALRSLLKAKRKRENSASAREGASADAWQSFSTHPLSPRIMTCREEESGADVREKRQTCLQQSAAPGASRA
jgi:hypothetical protein